MKLLRDIRRSPFAMTVIAVFCFLVWPALYFYIEHQASPISNVDFVGLQINGGKPRDLDNLIFVHRCDTMGIIRRVVATRQTSVLITRVFNSSDPTSRKVMSPGAEVFHGGLNLMTPSIQIPYDIKLGRILTYESSINDFIHPAVALPDFRVCVIARGQALPLHGGCPPPPTPPPPTTPCGLDPNAIIPNQ